MMEENGVEDISQLGGSGGTIQLALDALKEKKSSVDQVRRREHSLTRRFFCSLGARGRGGVSVSAVACSPGVHASSWLTAVWYGFRF